MRNGAFRTSFGRYDIALIVATAGWGLNFVITKSATGNAPEQFRLFVFNIIRFPLASALLFATAFFRGERIYPGRHTLRNLAILSFVGIFLYQVLYMSGQSMTSSANIGIIYSFTPLLILLMSAAAGVERPNTLTAMGVLLGCVGLVIVVFRGSKISLDVGSVLFLCALVCWAAYAVFGKRLLDRIPPVTTTAWMLLFGTLYQAPLAIWQLPDQSWSELAPINIVYVLLAAFCSLYLGYTLFYVAVANIGPTHAGIYTNLTPVFTLVFAVLIRHETIRTSQILGLAVILAGIALTRFPERNVPLSSPAGKATQRSLHE